MSTNLDTLRSMLSTAKSDQEANKARLAQYREDYRVDPWEDTAAQIKRMETRLWSGEIRINALEYAVNVVESVEDGTEPVLTDTDAAYHWTGWYSEEDEGVTDARPGVYWITICHPDGEEYASIIHRTFGGQFPLDGDLAKRKEADAQRIVDALNRK